MSVGIFKLILLLQFWSNIAAQCTIEHFAVSLDPFSPSTQLSVSWQCDAKNNEFAITYQLINRDQCDTGDGSLQDPFHYISLREWNAWDDVEMGSGNGPFTYSTSLPDLLPYSTYTISIQSRTTGGNPSYGDTQSTTVKTGEAVPSEGPIVRPYAKFSTYLELWFSPVQCGSRHGLITGYEYKLTRPNRTESLPVPEAVFTEMTFDGFPGVRISGLSCGIQYTLNVKPKNNAGTGRGFFITLFTETDPPGSVQNLMATSVSSSKLTVTWSEPADKGCPEVDMYEVMCEGTTRHHDECQNDFDLHTFMDITSSLTYTFDVRPFYSYNITVKPKGGSAVIITELTPGTAPTKSPDNVRITSSSDTNVTISWDEIPCSDRSGTILGYPYSLTLTSSSQRNTVANGEVSTTFVTVSTDALGTYSFSVAGRTEGGTGPSAHDTIKTIRASTQTTPTVRSSSMSNIPSSTVKSKSTSSSHSMKSSIANPVNTPTIPTKSAQAAGDNDMILVAAVSGVIVVILILIVVVVVLVVMARRRRKSNRPMLAKVELEIMDPVKESKIVENEFLENGGFQNDGKYPDLKKVGPDGKPSIKPRKHIPPKEEPDLQQSAEIDSIMEDDDALSVPPDRPPKPKVKSRKVKPVKTEHLEEYIRKQKANNSEGFKAEYDAIPSGQEYPWEESLKEVNKSKSRYKNIYPYDHSRILLEIIDGVPNSDYIDASLVKGYNDKAYIAAQGPSKGSMGDIWGMAWEQRSTKIVMLTNLVEQGKRKCQQYWPETNDPFVCSPMQVRCKKIKEYADFVIRDFSLEKDGEENPHELRQFHFISWPDMGVPEYPTQILNFIRLVNAFEPEGSGLPILHCSAGVGRTGTFITISDMLDMAAAEERIDVNGSVRKLRKDRINMVQTKEQYEFIFDTIQEAVLCGNTGIIITNLRQSFNELQTINKKTGHSKLEDQFKIIEKLTRLPTAEECSAGYAPENADKTRFPDRVPKDKLTPHLRATLDNGGTDYINASFIDGYLRQREFIATQMPLANTVEDFWTMVYELNSSSIVMLNRMSQSDPSFAMYWIDSGTKVMTNFTIEFQSTTPYMEEVTGRKFKLYPNGKPQEAINVQQFQLHNWPLGQAVPDSAAPLVTIYKSVQKWQKQQYKLVTDPAKLARGKPIIVHCPDGIESSGVFCALAIMLNKMKAEKVVDVFQSVKRVRVGRHDMIQSMDQYKFLYQAAQVSLDEFQTYENFR